MAPGGTGDDHALELADVTFGYGRGFSLGPIDLAVPSAAVVGLIGPNGSGKTTALQLATGLLRGGGRVLLDGLALGDEPDEAGRFLAFVPDSPAGFDHLTVQEYGALYGALRPADTGYAGRAALLVELLGLAPYRHRELARLSHGTRRKVAIAAGFASSAPLLVLDEATSALDPESVLVLRALVAERRQAGQAVLLATQDLYFAEHLCDEVHLLVDGRVHASGTVAGVLSTFGAANLYDVFGYLTGVADRLDNLHAALHPALPG